MFFKTTGNPTKSFDFLKRFGTLHDLLIDLLNEQISIKEAKKRTRCDDKKVNELSSFTSSDYFAEERRRNAIKKARTKTQRKEIYEAKKVL